MEFPLCLALGNIGMVMRFREMKMRQIIEHEKVRKDTLDIDPGVWDHQEFTSFPK